MMMSGWWFGTCFIFPHIGNAIIPTDFNIFQRGMTRQARAAIESKDHGALADLMDQNFNLRRSNATGERPGSVGTEDTR